MGGANEGFFKFLVMTITHDVRRAHDGWNGETDTDTTG